MKQAKENREFWSIIKGAMCLHGVRVEEMAVYCHMCPATFYSRMRNPEKLTIKEIKAMGKRLKLDVSALLSVAAGGVI